MKSGDWGSGVQPTQNKDSAVHKGVCGGSTAGEASTLWCSTLSQQPELGKLLQGAELSCQVGIKATLLQAVARDKGDKKWDLACLVRAQDPVAIFPWAPSSSFSKSPLSLNPIWHKITKAASLGQV